MLHAIEHAVLDTLTTFVVVYIVYFLVELFENKFSQSLERKQKNWSPLYGATFGLIPQCGFSVVATDLYSKKHLTMGTLIAIYISTSDEALPILLSSPDKAIMVLPLILSKFVLALGIGYLVDMVLKKRAVEVPAHIDNCHEHEEVSHTGCCHHQVEADHNSSKLKELFLHPLIHSLKICAYLLIFNIAFEILIHFIGEETIIKFLTSKSFLTPLFAVLVGLIPNCIGSVVLTQLYILGGISFGATLGGLIANAGLGFVVLFKNNKNQKENFFILGFLALVGIVVGYLVSFIPF